MPRKPKADPVPDHLKFGFEQNKVEAEVRAEMLAAGRDPADHHFFFDMVKERDRRFFEGRETYAEGCARRKAKWAAAAALRPKNYRPEFSEEELDYLLERLAFVNDPTGQVVLDKLKVLKNGEKVDSSGETAL